MSLGNAVWIPGLPAVWPGGHQIIGFLIVVSIIESSPAMVETSGFTSMDCFLGKIFTGNHGFSHEKLGLSGVIFHLKPIHGLEFANTCSKIVGQFHAPKNQKDCYIWVNSSDKKVMNFSGPPSNQTWIGTFTVPMMTYN